MHSTMTSQSVRRNKTSTVRLAKFHVALARQNFILFLIVAIVIIVANAYLSISATITEATGDPQQPGKFPFGVLDPCSSVVCGLWSVVCGRVDMWICGSVDKGDSGGVQTAGRNIIGLNLLCNDPCTCICI